MGWAQFSRSRRLDVATGIVTRVSECAAVVARRLRLYRDVNLPALGVGNRESDLAAVVGDDHQLCLDDTAIGAADIPHDQIGTDIGLLAYAVYVRSPYQH